MAKLLPNKVTLRIFSTHKQTQMTKSPLLKVVINQLVDAEIQTRKAIRKDDREMRIETPEAEFEKECEKMRKQALKLKSLKDLANYDNLFPGYDYDEALAVITEEIDKVIKKYKVIL